MLLHIVPVDVMALDDSQLCAQAFDMFLDETELPKCYLSVDERRRGKT